MDNDQFSSTAEAFEAFDDIALAPPRVDTIGAVIARRYSRRELLEGSLGVAAATALFGGAAALTSAPQAAQAAPVDFGFREVPGGVDETHHVADGYEAAILIRWGDPLFGGLPPFDPKTMTGEDQAKRFGYNNDYVAYFPLDRRGSRGLLCVNHEYANPEVMFPGVGVRPDRDGFAKITEAHVAVEMAAHGVSVVEVRREGNMWRPVVGGRFNRRITAHTEMTADGPAASHDLLKTKADPTGLKLWGTINNCAGGQTPWGTYLTGEENCHGYFWTDRKDSEGRRLTKGLGGALQKTHERYGIPSNWYSWGRFHERFNVDKEANECHRFNWIVEIDPHDPKSVPVKHTALGRFRHEGAEMVVNKDGRVVVFSGDDLPREYIYRYVSKDVFRPGNKARNRRLLSEGTLSVARFEADGSLRWLPLVFGTGPLTPANGFNSQADVLIYARVAADLLEATPMDRPEDVQPHPTSGKVYAMLTNNERLRPEQVNPANPRAANQFGHIIEMAAPQGNHAADVFTWEILIKCGDPRVADVGALWNPATSANGWFACPDNCAIDAQGRLWVATDQGDAWARKTNKADGLYAVGTEGASRGASKLFFRCPAGAEMCGPCFTPDGQTLFLSVQHPGIDGAKDWKAFGRNSTFDDPATRWPDFKPGMPPRPSMVVIRKTGGGRIGS